MKINRFVWFVTGLVLASAVLLIVKTYGTPSQTASAGGVTWKPPAKTWANSSSYSASYNDTMQHLWNELRLKEHWDAEDAKAIEYYLTVEVTFDGHDWDTTTPDQIENGSQYMQVANIFAEHLLIGGTIDPDGVTRIK